MFTLKILSQAVKYQFYAELEYPGAFVAGIIGQWIVYGAQMLMMFLTVWNFGSVAGYYPEEIIFLFAVSLLTYALAATFTFNICTRFDQIAINGTMDEALVRPMPPFLFLLATHVNVGYTSHITLSSAVLGISIWMLGLAWSAWEWLWFFIILAAGAVIISCIMLIVHMPAIRIRSRSPFAPLFWESWVFTQYPLIIYPKALQFIFTAVLPLAFVNFYPAQVLLGRRDGLWAPVTMWLSPVVAALLVVVTAFCWLRMSKSYESAGT